jgi:hypothetical protein
MGRELALKRGKELLEALVYRYRNSPKKDRTRILDEFVAISGSRTHAVRLLGGKRRATPKQRSTSAYDEAVKRSLLPETQIAFVESD